ncbi:hypothetical protein YM304_36590 [Ilumatobacter coccineus YM16-304]|uniref:Uncharacterized protein n=1 Tax=Ilumatobacter coccineus (strain NBRC 103263 / KCTC 29153 / YM16-304) TaxID=1313172 RepID=A0A6C7ECC8_ILUCY|nr:hypothetical protein YM304_36590 [Ilumatobacter coccineus YM16-304]
MSGQVRGVPDRHFGTHQAMVRRPRVEGQVVLAGLSRTVAPKPASARRFRSQTRGVPELHRAPGTSCTLRLALASEHLFPCIPGRASSRVLQSEKRCLGSTRVRLVATGRRARRK